MKRQSITEAALAGLLSSLAITCAEPTETSVSPANFFKQF
jgi:hypothetical protein